MMNMIYTFLLTIYLLDTPNLSKIRSRNTFNAVSYTHLTTVCSLFLILCRCISFDSYIKPQLVLYCIIILLVVYLFIPTSNHNYIFIHAVSYTHLDVYKRQGRFCTGRLVMASKEDDIPLSFNSLSCMMVSCKFMLLYICLNAVSYKHLRKMQMRQNSYARRKKLCVSNK